jgi:hypothetical protein
LQHRGESATLADMRRLAPLRDCFNLLPSRRLCRQSKFKSSAAAAAHDPQDGVVVMISLDGLGGFYLDDPKAQMPTLRALAAEGVVAKMKASNPTVTWPNHTTLVTGVHPARHGVVGNNYLDRATSKPVTLIADPLSTRTRSSRSPRSYDVAHAAGLKTAGILWPASRNAKTLDWTIPDVHEVALYEKYSTPSLLAEMKSAGIPSPLEPVRDVDLSVTKDEVDTRIFNHILQTHRPQLALLHLANVDHMQHLKGPRTPDAVRRHRQDRFAGARCLGGDEARFSRQGNAGHRLRSRLLRHPARDLPQRHPAQGRAGRRQGPAHRRRGRALVPQGGSAMLYISAGANRNDTVARVQEAFTGIKGVRKVVTPDALKEYGLPDPKRDPRGPDMLLLADEGYIFGDTAAGELPFAEKPERLGSHGHDATIPDLRATFIAWGSGIRHTHLKGDIENIDVTPTLAKLLKLDMPNLDGKPITAALKD